MKHPPKNLTSLTKKSIDNNLKLSISRLQHLKIEVSEHLLQLHQGVNLNQNLIESTLWEIAEAEREFTLSYFALSYIGINKQSYREIIVLELKIRLQGWLKVLRNGTTLYKNYLYCLLEEIERVNLAIARLSTNEIERVALTLADIGTNEQELRELEILGFKLSAEGWLKRIAAGDYNSYFVLISFIREQVVIYELTLDDINTTKEKLEELIAFAAKKEALSWLGYLRESSARNEYFTENLLRNVEIGGFLLKEIGTDEEELQKLLARPPESRKSKSPKISENKARRYKNFTENLFNRGLFFKVLLELKNSFSWKEPVWIKTFFSNLHGKIHDWNLIHHQH